MTTTVQASAGAPTLSREVLEVSTASGPLGATVTVSCASSGRWVSLRRRPGREPSWERVAASDRAMSWEWVDQAVEWAATDPVTGVFNDKIVADLVAEHFTR